MTITDENRVYYDPYDAGINTDPYPTYRRLRDQAPIYYNERFDVWALARHADVEQGLVNWQTFSNTRSDILEIIQSGMELPPGVVMFEDPPLHTMHRGLMSRVFSPRRMNELEEQVRAYCRACLDPLVGSDRFDFVADVGELMPMRVIGMLLGIPESDQVAVRTKQDASYGTTVPTGSAILLLVGSANRDERRYDDPDRFDIHRDLGQHLTFGYGMHFCLGAALARLEGRVALDEVLNRFPDWEVDHDHITLASTTTVRGWESMPVFVG